MVFGKIKEIIREIGITDEIYPETLLCDDLAMDSTELVDLASAIMKEFGVMLKSSELKKCSVAKLIEFINKK